MKLETLQVREVSNGVIQGVDDRLAPKNSVAFALNMRFDEILGRATLRKGSVLVGSQITASESILGLYQFILSSGTKYLLSVINGASVSQIMRLESNVWATTGSDGQMTKDVKTRFLTYLDTVMALDGVKVISSVDGTAWVATGGNLDVANCPLGKFSIEWHDRVFVAGVSGYLDRLYYSSVPTSGAISWTVGNGYIDIEPYHGQGAITGLAKVPNYLLIFKDRALKRWNGNSIFPDDLCNIGSPSQESIVNGKISVLYFSASFKTSIGFYETDGANTRKVSRPIQNIIDVIDPANYSSVAGFSDGEMALWSIGDITYDGITYTNVVVMYDIESKTWTVFSFPSKFNIFAPYIDSTTLKIISGNSNGEVIEILTGTTDNLTGNSNIPIEYAIQYQPIDFGIRGNIKELSSIIPYTKFGADTKLLIRVDETDQFKERGVVEDDFESEIDITGLKGHCFEIRLAGETKAGSTQIIGFDIIEPEMSATIKK